MPGPRNMKKKAKHQAKKARRSQGGLPLDNEQDASTQQALELAACADDSADVYPASSTEHPEDTCYSHEQPLDPPPQDTYYPPVAEDAYPHHHTAPAPQPLDEARNDEPIPPSLVTEPFIYDPGNGPRVRNVSSFLASSFAAPPTLDDPLCAEFAQEEMLEMLCAVLPEETALVRRVVHARQVELTRARSCGTTRAGGLRGYVPRVNDYTG